MLLQQGELCSGLHLNSLVSLSVVWLHWDSLPGWTGEVHQRAGRPCDQPAEDGGTKIWHGRVPLWQAHPRGQWQWELKSCQEPPCGFQWDSYFTVQPCMHLQLSRLTVLILCTKYCPSFLLCFVYCPPSNKVTWFKLAFSVSLGNERPVLAGL